MRLHDPAGPVDRVLAPATTGKKPLLPWDHQERPRRAKKKGAKSADLCDAASPNGHVLIMPVALCALSILNPKLPQTLVRFLLKFADFTVRTTRM